MSIHQLKEVFGVSNAILESYISREQVDGEFRNAINNTDHHIVVYGASKQGKTSLVKRNLKEKKIEIQCSPTSSTDSIYKSILRKIGVEIKTSSESTTTSGREYGISANASWKIPFFGSAGVEAGGKGYNDAINKDNYKTIEFDLKSADDVATIILDSGHRGTFFVLENFHYLQEDAQRLLAKDIRLFQDMGVRFVILGVWREKNKLLAFNGDLSDRLDEVAVEPWSRSEFIEVIKLGETALNISFSDAFKNKLIESAFDSIGVVQDLLKISCEIAGIKHTNTEKIQINDLEVLSQACAKKATNYAARHVPSMKRIAEGRRTGGMKKEKTPLYLPYYLVKFFLTKNLDNIELGVRKSDLATAIQKMHHRTDTVPPGSISYLLSNIAKLQHEKLIDPPIFDYDEGTSTLRVVDSTFYFFLRNIDRDSILHDIPKPSLIDQKPSVGSTF